MRIAFAGLGRMGAPMAANLLRAGHAVAVYNRTAGRTAELEALGATVAATPAAAAAGAELAVTMLADDDAAERVVLGADGLLGALPRGAAHAAMSTISAALSRRLADAHAAAGLHYVAAPVFGRPEAAAAAKLWIVAAGDEAAIAACRPAFAVLGQGVFVAGPEPETANVVKLAGNFMLASTIEALAEAQTLVRAWGVDPGAFMTVMNALFRSPIVESYGGAIAARRFEPAGFALALGLKDVRLALAAADARSAPMPFASCLHDRFLAAVGHGFGRIDWSGIARLAAADAGLPE
ncbi:MAG: NAD(P)-dependent oxidoreductase [Thermoanaerobaculaceae bacterium]|nr:NAD(P)-dependent oxidoreductase [Thermoanaerobaculaceae bacterium]